MVTLHTSELLSFIASWFFPFVRIGACLMVAPVFGASYVPARMRLVLAIAIAALVAPLASVPQVDLLSIGSALITVQQIVIGVALGFGAQNIIKNLISGVIILFERKIRVGDTVTINSPNGTLTLEIRDVR